MIELAGLIEDLREELERAIEAGKGEKLRFELGQIELEASVAIERTGSGGAKVRFWVAELGAERKSDNTATQRIKLVLVPRLAGSDKKPYVSGDPVQDER